MNNRYGHNFELAIFIVRGGRGEVVRQIGKPVNTLYVISLVLAINGMISIKFPQQSLNISGTAALN